MPVHVSGAVEGLVDQAVFGRLLRVVNADVGHVYLTNGKSSLLRRLHGFNAAAKHTPWLVLIDLDDDAECAPPFRARYLPKPARRMACRVAVRAVEAWLLADRERFSRWLEVPIGCVPHRSEDISDPKRALVNFARKSPAADVREDMVPRHGSGRQVGPLYSSRLIEFVQDEKRGWRPRVAARFSDSLDRCIRHLAKLVTTAESG